MLAMSCIGYGVENSVFKWIYYHRGLSYQLIRLPTDNEFDTALTPLIKNEPPTRRIVSWQVWRKARPA